jgi:hypothetical protein
MTSDPAVPMAEQVFEPLFPQKEPDDQSSYAYRQLIGILGLLFPFVILLIAHWRPTPVLKRFGILPSVSAYYYTGSVAVFVGILVALGLFLLTYEGYKNDYGRRDRIASRIAGWAAIFVAFFPTAAPDATLAPFWWRPATGAIHFSAAAVLFCSFAYISLFLFTQTRQAKGTPQPTEKRVRNSIYIFCGVVMVGCIAWAGVASYRNAPIFLPEAIALEAFALSWLTKGRAERTIAGVAKRAWYYGRNPMKAAGKVWSAIRK